MKNTPKLYWFRLICCFVLLCGITGTEPVKATRQKKILTDATLYFPIVFKRFSPGAGTVTGKVIDANTRAAIANVTVCWESKCDITNVDGIYAISEILAGHRTLGTLHPDYYQTESQVWVIANDTVILDFALSHTLSGDVDYRIVLTWDPTEYWPCPDYSGGKCPNDLDAHLILEAPVPFHIFYDNKGDTIDYPYAKLEYDYTDGFGPETIDFSQIMNGVIYHFAVDNVNWYYLGMPPITQLNAQVQIYSSQGLIKTYNVPTSGQGSLWYVFTMNVTKPPTITISDINCLTTMPDPIVPTDTNTTPPPECP